VRVRWIDWCAGVEKNHRDICCIDLGGEVQRSPSVVVGCARKEPMRQKLTDQLHVSLGCSVVQLRTASSVNAGSLLAFGMLRGHATTIDG
jgi:hypothetical protein